MSKSLSPGQRVIYYFVGLVGYWFISLYFLTLRFINNRRSRKALRRNLEPGGIYPFWHSHQLCALIHYQHTRAAIMVSQSRDGEYIARIAARAGFLPVRGSSSRAGAPALKELLRLALAGRTIAITPDGPRGPRHTVHPGVIALAQSSGRPVTPVAIGLSAFWELPSWDRFRIPKPFAVSYGCWGEELHVPPDADEAKRAELARVLQERMIALEAHADRTARMLRRARRRVDLPDAE